LPENLVSIFIGISTGAVAIATILLWRATKKVVEATTATKDMAKEVATYSIIPRFELVKHQRKKQDGYHQYAVKMINNGKDTAYKVIVETKSNKISSTRNVPFNLPVGYQIWLSHSVMTDDNTIHFKIDFEDVAGNHHTRELSYKITNDQSTVDSFDYELATLFPDNYKM